MTYELDETQVTKLCRAEGMSDSGATLLIRTLRENDFNPGIKLTEEWLIEVDLGSKAEYVMSKLCKAFAAQSPDSTQTAIAQANAEIIYECAQMTESWEQTPL